MDRNSLLGVVAIGVVLVGIVAGGIIFSIMNQPSGSDTGEQIGQATVVSIEDKGTFDGTRYFDVTVSYKVTETANITLYHRDGTKLGNFTATGTGTSVCHCKHLLTLTDSDIVRIAIEHP